MRVVLLGATGFIGRAVLEILRAEGLVTVASEPAQRARLASGDPSVLDELAANGDFDAVVNCAGALSGTRRALEEANVGLVAGLLDILEARDPGCFVVQVASAAEYGPQEQPGPIGPSAACHPESAYAITKLAATQLVLEASATGRVQGTVLRVFNPVGPGMSTGTVLGSVMGQLARNPRGDLRTGPLDAARDFVHVDDVGRAVLAALRSRPAGRLFNVGRGEAVSVRSMVHTLRELARHSGGLVEQGSGSSRSAGLQTQQADIDDTVRLLDWRPTGKLGDALQAGLAAALEVSV